MASEDAIRGGIRRFMAEAFLIDFDREVGPDTDLFEAGLLDSFGFVELVGFLEHTYGLELTDEDFESPLISSLAGLQTLALQRLGEAVS